MSRIRRILCIMLIITLFGTLVLISCNKDNKEELPNNGDNTSGENGGNASPGGTEGGNGGTTDNGSTGGDNGTVNNKPGEGLEFTLSSDGTYYEVSGIGTCTDKCLVIPSKYNGKPVKAIGESAFTDEEYVFYKNNFTSVIIPDSVTRIGYFAFYGCYELATVNYRGTEEEWNNINKNGSALSEITVAYNYTGE